MIFKPEPNTFSWNGLITSTIKSSYPRLCVVHCALKCFSHLWLRPRCGRLLNEAAHCSLLSNISVFSVRQCVKSSVDHPVVPLHFINTPWEGAWSIVTVLGTWSLSDCEPKPGTVDQWSFVPLLWSQTNMPTTRACKQALSPSVPKCSDAGLTHVTKTSVSTAGEEGETSFICVQMNQTLG